MEEIRSRGIKAGPLTYFTWQVTCQEIEVPCLSMWGIRFEEDWTLSLSLQDLQRGYRYLINSDVPRNFKTLTARFTQLETSHGLDEPGSGIRETYNLPFEDVCFLVKWGNHYQLSHDMVVVRRV